jgi:hypothetical protein
VNQNLKQFIYAIILLGGGLYLGKMYGTIETYKETGRIIVGSHFDEATTNLDMHITILQLLYARDFKGVSENLENLVDGDLVALAKYADRPERYRIPSIKNSIEKAKQYRQEHSRTNQSAEVSSAVKKVFESVK